MSDIFLKKSNVFKLRFELRNHDKYFYSGISNENELAILEFINFMGETTISDICKHSYFSDLSISSINRVVFNLKKGNHIISYKSDDDKRVVYLVPVD